MSKIRVLLVDDHAILREGLRALLAYHPEVEVVGEAGDGQAALAQVAELHPDVVLMDIAMPRLGGLEATRQIGQKFRHTRVLVLTQYEDWQYVVPLLQAGAAGYLPKRALGTDLITALRTVAQGDTFLYPSVSTTVVEVMRGHPPGEPQGPEALTPREQEVLRGIVLGHTNLQIAANLSLSVKTVEWHRANLMSKLGVHNIADLVRYALQHGLVESNPQPPAPTPG
jgi:DNA-binding NarL/FixJ family response regulator